MNSNEPIINLEIFTQYEITLDPKIREQDKTNDNSINEFAKSINMFFYEGYRRIANNLVYYYEDGRLSRVIDSRGNISEVFFDDYYDLIKIQTNEFAMIVKINEFGFLTYYNIIGTNIGAKYIYSEYGAIENIIRNDIEINISYDIYNEVQHFSINDTIQFEYEVSFCKPQGILIPSSLDDIQASNALKIPLNASIDIENSSYVSLFYEQLINISTMMDSSTFGLYDRMISFYNSDKTQETLVSSTEVLATDVNELIRVDKIIYRQKDNVFSYVINDMGFISRVYSNDILIEEYFYDAVTGALVIVYNHESNSRTEITYDESGNILSRMVYSPKGFYYYNFKYNNSDWSDQLTYFNGVTLLYDDFGNMINGLGLNLIWENNQLIQIERNGCIVVLTYNEYGLINSRTINDITTYFIYYEDIIIAEYSTNGTHITYIFDNEMKKIGFIFNDSQYFYLTNFFGDVVGILDEEMNLVVEYSYDAWGNLLSKSGIYAETIGRVNPIRYRGYRFDEITELYYLNGLFYSPIIGRFINPSDTLGVIGNSISHNLYAYALNNPIANMVEPASATVATVILTFLFIIGTVTVSFFLLSQFFARNQFVQWQNTFMTAIDSLGSQILSITDARRFGQEVMNRVRAASDAVRTGQRTGAHNHHIVARTHTRAAHARTIYHHYWFSIDNSINLVAIRQSLHSRLHTNMYFDTVNAIMDRANGGLHNTTRFTIVSGAMNRMRNVLLAASNMSP